MSAPPIPSLKPYHCPNCGLPLDEPVEICPVCGERITRIGITPPWLRILGAIVLGFFVIPLSLAGACFLLIAPSGISGLSNTNHTSESLFFGFIGLVLVGLAVLCVIGILKLLKR